MRRLRYRPPRPAAIPPVGVRASTERQWHLPAPSVADAYHPPAAWQTPALRLALPSGTVTLDTLNIPEGCVFVARCSCCGGRGEWMADLRGTSSSRAQPATDDLIQRYVNVFVDAHATCEMPPSAEPMDPRVRVRVHDVIAEARRALRAGAEVTPRLVLLTSGGARSFDLPHLPAAALNEGADHRQAIARVHYGIRALIRRDKLHVHAVIMTQLAWGSADPRVVRGHLTPGEAPDRFEFLLVTVQTPNWAGLAMISLAGTSADAGVLLPSDGEPQWQVVGQPSLLIDGMLATPVAPAHTQSRATGNERGGDQ